jgi:hypothetical protein
MHIYTRSGLILTSLTLLALAGCSSKTMVESDLHIKGAPDWVNEGTQMLNDKDGRLFHGVGSAAPMGNESLQKSTADERARAELARVLNSYLSVASKDYSAAASSGDESVSEQSVSRQIDNLTQINLTGARIIGRWRDTRTGTLYSIAELDMKRMKETLEKAEQMSPGLRDFITRESDTLFDRIAGDDS